MGIYPTAHMVRVPYDSAAAADDDALHMSSWGPINPFGPDTPLEQLREIARESLSKGQLPVISTRRLQANYGGPGAKCELCRGQIQRRQVQYHVTDIQDGRSFTFHLSCHGAWQLECDSRQANTPEAKVSAQLANAPQQSSDGLHSA
jgi:hypothetical protein